MINKAFGNRIFINGKKPITLAKSGKIDETTKKIIPINNPTTIRFPNVASLYLPKRNGIAKKSIIIVENGLNNFSQKIIFCSVSSKLLFSK